jgi:DNA-directed RNA polymerase specialized sigma24 family protein
MTEPDTDINLDEVRLQTRMIREHQREIENLGSKRKRTIMRLRANLITYRKIAEAMETSEQNVYKIIRDEIPTNPRLGPDGEPLPKRGRPRAS